MNISKAEKFDAPHNNLDTVFSREYTPERTNDGKYGLRRTTLIPTKPRGSDETTHAENLWLDKNDHWNTEENAARFDTKELAQSHWVQFCEANGA